MSGDLGARVVTAHYDSRLLPPDQRLAEFERITPGYDIVLPDRGESFFCNSYGWLLQDLVLTSNEVSAIDLVRSPAHLKSYVRDTYTFILAQRGRWWAELDYGHVHVGSGQVAIMDFTVPWHVHGTAQQNVMLVVPRPVVHAGVPHAPRLHGKLLDSTSGRLFAEHLVALARHMPEMKEEDVPLIRDATVALLQNALAALPRDEGPPSRPPAMRTTSIVRIQAFIEDHLKRPNLSAALICRELAVTRPTLYRAFAPWGGVASFIQRRRLEAAHSRLSDSNVHASMAEIAAEYCFSSQAHFSTAFRRRFGYTPSDAKASPRRAGETLELFGTYLRAMGKAPA